MNTAMSHPLHNAARSGDLVETKRLLDAGSDPGLQDNFGWTAQEFAAYEGHLAVARLFSSHIASRSQHTDSC